MHACMHVCIYIHTYIHTYRHTDAFTHTHTHTTHLPGFLLLYQRGPTTESPAAVEAVARVSAYFIYISGPMRRILLKM